ncbi:MAG: Vancomycin B-type resistance protein VanW [Syntrophomonadaceae bacterium]|nr:Vancomycin B-type resistance protein VanW [Bacillota bacterium]
MKINGFISRPAFQAVTALTLLLLVVADYFFYRDRIYPGVYLYGINVGGLAKIQAGQLVQKKVDREELLRTTVLFQYNEKAWSYTCGELGMAVDWADTLARAFAAGRNRPVMLNYPERVSLLLKPVKLPLSFVVDRTQFSQALAPAAQLIEREPQEARFVLAEDGVAVKIAPEIPGRSLLMEETRQLLENSFEAYGAPGTLPLLVREIKTARTALDLRKLRVHAEVASFSTEFALSLPGRVHNIRLAASALDEFVLKPGDEFSFNAVVGEAGAAQGYLPAPVIVAGEIVEGFGGGVCQVSSTLYNAMLLAGLQLVERTAHSLAIGYLPPGRDAAVVYGWQDLKFFNNQNHGIWIRTFADGNSLTVRLFGEPTPGKQIKVLTTDLEVIPRSTQYTETDSLAAGTRVNVKKGQDGYRVAVWRITYLNGMELGRELLSRDFYRPVPAEVQIGTGNVSLR